MAEAKSGDKVKVHYTGKLKDGTIFDSSQGRDPLEFTLGQGQIIPGFEQAVEGMNPGETREVEIPSGEAYGPHRDEMVLDVPKTQLPEGLEPQVGQQLQMSQPSGQDVPVMVTEVNDETIKLDANHPLAGKDLIFDIELLEVA